MAPGAQPGLWADLEGRGGGAGVSLRRERVRV